MNRPAPGTWNGCGGRKASNVRPVVVLVIRGVFGPAPAWSNVVTAAIKSVSLPESTIAHERETNPFMQQPDFQSFVHLKKNWAAYKAEHGIA